MVRLQDVLHTPEGQHAVAQYCAAFSETIHLIIISSFDSPLDAFAVETGLPFGPDVAAAAAMIGFEGEIPVDVACALYLHCQCVHLKASQPKISFFLSSEKRHLNELNLKLFSICRALIERHFKQNSTLAARCFADDLVRSMRT